VKAHVRIIGQNIKNIEQILIFDGTTDHQTEFIVQHFHLENFIFACFLVTRHKGSHTTISIYQV
jgi:hypothetical protein